ncbi:hypothetical protein N0V93_009686 [Gnomoniopsis smithogilvyi]|uniref:V-snare n=1 Tax=Gnomoniopsis smithogilvyi TaxID=1191159 RepID=A0A9W9CTW9_9PEZI|nr:hypothetical protein N0V93_009686 [Gnomoniopsis smithogilvyi]
MAAKRDLETMLEPDGDAPSSPAPSTKRSRNSDNAGQKKSKKQQAQEAATDLTYGQRYCFPSVHDTLSNSDEDLDFEDETDALAYLQSVRHEASGIPHLLVAPKSGPQLPPACDPDSLDDRDDDDDDDEDDDQPVDRSIYATGYGDARGYYKDGAYTAAPSSSPPTPPPSHDAIDAAYFACLITQFDHLRTILHRDPPASVLATLTSAQSPHVGAFGPRSRTFAVWSSRMRETDPHPAQVAAMDKGAVLRLLRVLLGGKFLRTGVELRERTSRWIWALLARLPDRGEMDHMEVGHVRELGKRAALLMHSLMEMAALREEVELGGHDGDAGAEEWVGDVEVEPEAETEAEVEADERVDETKGRDSLENATSDPVIPPSTTAPGNEPPADEKVEVDDNDDDDVEDGEIADESEPMDLESDIESAKARLLANLDSVEGSPHSEDESGSKYGGEQSFDPVRSRMNMRATLNMILTVAGEFYGQRDLLEFRDPFHGI